MSNPNKTETRVTVGPYIVVNRREEIRDRVESGTSYSSEVLLADGATRVLSKSGYDQMSRYGEQGDGFADLTVVQGDGGKWQAQARNIKSGKTETFELNQ